MPRLACAALLSMALHAHAAHLRIAAPSDSQLSVLQQQLVLWQQRTGHTVEVVKLTNASGDVFVQYRTWLASKNREIDVYKFDSQWAGQLQAHLVHLRPYTQQHERMLPQVVAAWRGRGGALLGLPYTVGVPQLFYRRDLLEKYGRPVPRTWAELTDTARLIQQGERAAGRRGFWGYVFQGAVYEGLAANALEWVASSGGGRIVEDDGRISIGNPRAARALARAAGWVGAIAPRGVLGYKEDDARGVFQTGNAAFMRHWPAAWALLDGEAGSAVAGRTGIAPLPAGDGGQPAATLGGWGYVVSKHSPQRDAAAALAVFLSSEEAQRLSAARSLPPTYAALYDDADLARAAPLLPALKAALPTLVARPAAPTGRRYPEVSAEFQSAVHRVLEGRDDAAGAVEKLQRRLERVRGAGW
ncbi:ABC transporter substrate-binding protein [Xylophilus sp.]|uniref:ABC transporter substrate-binding protein n=1 Tax=Xylophilus sp. TaxID=2653893 RepID=UPI0013B92D83|nr:ABC transporter substrate-binding protein [Xylophilus sp.]KAF1048213.1 MAG: putative ABC transporter-binding protein [Xylophilus sp.]